MEGLRIIGFLFGVFLILWALIQFKKGLLKRIHFLPMVLVGFGLNWVAVFPDSVFFINSILSMEKTQYSRIIAILISSNFVLWAIILFLRQATIKNEQKINLLVSALGSDEFESSYGNINFEKVVIVIPAYNEDENLGQLLQTLGEVKFGFKFSVLVIDDGSRKKINRDVLPDFCYVVANKINSGGGSALRLGFKIARDAGAKIIVTMDADNQHDPIFIPHLIAPVIEEKTDIVIGSRILGENQDGNLIRFIGIHFYNFLINFIIRAKTTDCSSGFRAIKAECLSKLHLIETQYHTSELIIEASKKNMKITEVPIVMKPRLYGETKKGGTLKYGMSFFRVIIQTWFRENR